MHSYTLILSSERIAPRTTAREGFSSHFFRVAGGYVPQNRVTYITRNRSDLYLFPTYLTVSQLSLMVIGEFSW